MEMQAVLIASGKSKTASTFSTTAPGVVEVVSPGGSSKALLSLADQLDQLKTQDGREARLETVPAAVPEAAVPEAAEGNGAAEEGGGGARGP